MSKKKQTPPVPRCVLCKGFINILDNGNFTTLVQWVDVCKKKAGV